MEKLSVDPGTIQNSERFYYLDAARAIALLLGIFFHGVTFMVSYIPPMVWAIKDQQSNPGVDVFYFISHSFRMQAFFLVAGFFAHMIYHKYGAKGFIIHRFKRITRPLLLFWPFIYLFVSMAWIWGYQTMGYFHSNPDIAKYSFFQIVIGNFTTGNWLNEGFPLTHLWFLYMLTWFFIVALIIRWLFEVVIDRNLHLRTRFDQCIAFLMNRWWGSLVLALFTLPAMWYMRNGLGVDTPDRGLLPKVPSFIVFFAYFSLGWLLQRNQQCVECFKKFWKSNLIIGFGLLTTVCLLFFLQFNSLYVQRFMTDPFFSKAFSSLYGLASMTSVFAFIGVMKVFFAGRSRLIRYLSDSSYWLYLIHLPIVVFFQVLAVPLPVHWTLKMCIIFVPSFVIMFATYHFFVRKTWIGVMLNGKKY